MPRNSKKSNCETKKEVTLDRSCNPATKGHFSSLLVSNIFLNPLFLLSTSRFFLQLLNTVFFFLKREIAYCYRLLSALQKVKCLGFFKVFARSVRMLFLFSLIHFVVHSHLYQIATRVLFFSLIRTHNSICKRFALSKPLLCFHWTVPPL